MLRKQQEEPDGPKYGCIGSSEPYLESDAIYDMPDAVPQVIRDLIQAQQGEARKAAEEAELKLTCPDMLLPVMRRWPGEAVQMIFQVRKSTD